MCACIEIKFTQLTIFNNLVSNSEMVNPKIQMNENSYITFRRIFVHSIYKVQQVGLVMVRHRGVRNAIQNTVLEILFCDITNFIRLRSDLAMRNKKQRL